MNKQDIRIALRIGLLIVLVVFLITFNLANKTDCNTCEFKVDGKERGLNGFMDAYTERCVDKGSGFSVDFANITIRK